MPDFQVPTSSAQNGYIMIIFRRWQRWLRWSFLIVSSCVVVLLLRNILVAVGGLSSFETENGGKVVFDHWGVGIEDIAWLPNLIKQQTEEIPVVIVEEHHEVIKYWFQASDHGGLPMSKNILIHIDGHVDGAVPYETENIPWFRYPGTRKQIHAMMQRNDMFIVSAALTGLFNRMIWVWPQWDLEDHDEGDRHVVIKIKMGITKVRIEAEDGRYKSDLCACWRVLEEYEKIDGYEPGAAAWECHRRNFYEIDLEEGPVVSMKSCVIHSEGILEVMSENRAVTELSKLPHSSGLILDIDEDFFGCYSDMISLQAEGVSYKQVKLLSDLVSDFLCATTASQEQNADIFYLSLVRLIIKLKTKGCEHMGHQGRKEMGDKCLSNLEISNYVIQNVPVILDFLEDVEQENVMCHPDPKLRGLFLQSLLQYLQNFSIKQLQLLLSMGICFQVSPPSIYFETDGRLHVCIGDNMPNRTQVTFYLPTKEDIIKQTVNLRKILSSVTQKPNIVTVSRSVRDGYTPKQFAAIIESNILQTLGAVYRSINFVNIHYDTNLLGGKTGWMSRYQTWSRELMEYLSPGL